MFSSAGTTTSGAIFSDCRLYRYLLWRVWDESQPIMSFIGLNPSTADEIDNDRTITRIINYAKRWGFGGLVMLNLFAWRSTDRSVLKKLKSKAIGLDNDAAIEYGIVLSKRVVLGWGNDGWIDNRSAVVSGLIRRLAKEEGVEVCVLKYTDKNQPQHPLYLPANLEPIQVLL